MPRDGHHRTRAHRRQPSGTTSERSDGFEALARRALEFAARRYGESNSSGGPSTGPGSSRDHTSSSNEQSQPQPRGLLDNGDITMMIVLQVAQFLLRRYLHHQRTRSNAEAAAPTVERAEPVEGCRAPGQSELTDRDLAALLPALDDVLRQLHHTEELVERTLYRPARHEGCGLHRSVVLNADILQRSIGRASASVRHVQEVLQAGRPGGQDLGHHHHLHGSAAEYYSGHP